MRTLSSLLLWPLTVAFSWGGKREEEEEEGYQHVQPSVYLFQRMHLSVLVCCISKTMFTSLGPCAQWRGANPRSWVLVVLKISQPRGKVEYTVPVILLLTLHFSWSLFVMGPTHYLSFLQLMLIMRRRYMDSTINIDNTVVYDCGFPTACFRLWTYPRPNSEGHQAEDRRGITPVLGQIWSWWCVCVSHGPKWWLHFGKQRCR